MNLAFVSQSASDIRKKLQRMEGFEGKNLSELVKTAQRVFNNRDEVDIAQTKKRSCLQSCKEPSQREHQEKAEAENRHLW